jgi:hypothetical protein
MALNTSSGAYEQLFDTSAPENSDTYYEGYVEMKLNFIKVCCVFLLQTIYILATR